MMNDKTIHSCKGVMEHVSRDCLQPEYYLDFAPGVCSGIINSWNEVEKFISKNIDKYPFIKTCCLSPKDWTNPPCFKSTNEALIALRNSTRTRNVVDDNLHIIMKVERNYLSEARCFIIDDKPQMVCGNMDHDLVVEYLKNKIFPYEKLCLEIGEYEVGKVECIEINSINAQMDPFDNEQDLEKLYVYTDRIDWGDI